jgi:hypothetical protein
VNRFQGLGEWRSPPFRRTNRLLWHAHDRKKFSRAVRGLW